MKCPKRVALRTGKVDDFGGWPFYPIEDFKLFGDSGNNNGSFHSISLVAESTFRVFGYGVS